MRSPSGSRPMTTTLAPGSLGTRESAACAVASGWMTIRDHGADDLMGRPARRRYCAVGQELGDVAAANADCPDLAGLRRRGGRTPAAAELSRGTGAQGSAAARPACRTTYACPALGGVSGVV